MDFLQIINDNVIYIVLGLSALCLMLFILCIVALCKTSKLKKRINKFMLIENPDDNIETMLLDFIDDVKGMSAQHGELLSSISDINNRLQFCIQKSSIIRYNPFDEVGGDLCFSIALLDEKDNGIILSGIYSRDGSYTYAKPIESGTCTKYKLSSEEEEALNKALSN